MTSGPNPLLVQQGKANRLLFAQKEVDISNLKHENNLLHHKLAEIKRKNDELSTLQPKILHFKKLLQFQQNANKQNDRRNSTLVAEINKLSLENIKLTHLNTTLQSENYRFEQDLQKLLEDFRKQKKELNLTRLLLESKV